MVPPLGSVEHINSRARESVQAFHASFCHFGVFFHAPTAVVVTRQRANNFKLLYHIRINGGVLEHGLRASFDANLKSAVSTSLIGYLPGSLLVAGGHHWRSLEEPWHWHRSVDCRPGFDRQPDCLPPLGLHRG